MHDRLKTIIQQKQLEVAALKAELPEEIPEKIKNFSLNTHNKKSFKQALSQPGLAFIGEIKRRSPSKGQLASIADPLVLLDQYRQGGISAVSVLTDELFFGGSLDDLQQVATQLNDSNIAVLRKDFIIDECQFIQSLAYGANCILLIVAVLKERTADLLNKAKELGIDAIVEVHDKAELDLAVSIGAEIIGINNRNLHTFAEDINVCIDLVQYIPQGVVSIAESAIRSAEDIKKVNAAGFDAVLIGEALVRSAKPAETLQQMRAVL